MVAKGALGLPDPRLTFVFLLSSLSLGGAAGGGYGFSFSPPPFLLLASSDAPVPFLPSPLTPAGDLFALGSNKGADKRLASALFSFSSSPVPNPPSARPPPPALRRPPSAFRPFPARQSASTGLSIVQSLSQSSPPPASLSLSRHTPVLGSPPPRPSSLLPAAMFFLTLFPSTAPPRSGFRLASIRPKSAPQRIPPPCLFHPRYCSFPIISFRSKFLFSFLCCTPQPLPPCLSVPCRVPLDRLCLSQSASPSGVQESESEPEYEVGIHKLALLSRLLAQRLDSYFSRANLAVKTSVHCLASCGKLLRLFQ